MVTSQLSQQLSNNLAWALSQEQRRISEATEMYGEKELDWSG